MTLAVMALLLGACAAPPRTSVLAPDPGAGGIIIGGIPSERLREIALHALSHIGVPYRYGGNSPQTGFDCSGLVGYVYSRGAGVRLPRSTEALSAVGTPVAPESLEPGDLVFFDTLSKPYSHVGIYLGDERFIHAPATGGHVELVDMRKPYWRTRFNGARRIAL